MPKKTNKSRHNITPAVPSSGEAPGEVEKASWPWWLQVLALVGFSWTRWHLWINRPLDFSEIIYSYMPYAHLWASGVKPYLEQWYEYPPGTIPLFYIPHVIDMTTRWWPVHIDYLHGYRGLMLLIDIFGFWLIWQALKKSQVKTITFALSMVFYLAVTGLANHFIYDSMDLAFTVSLLLGAVAPVIWNQTKTNFPNFFPGFGQVMGWLGYFLATCLKLINAPLGLPLLATELPWATLRQQLLKKQLSLPALWTAYRLPLLKTGLTLGIAGALVWGAPLVLYRSSLQVMFVYHQQRGLQVDTPAATIVRTLNESVKSDTIIEIYKNYEVTGPMSQRALRTVNLLFPLALAVFLLGTTSWLIFQKTLPPQQTRLWVTLGYVLVFMMFGKVLSRPFMLWPLPLIAALPLRSWRAQLALMIPAYALVWVTFMPIGNDAWFGLPLPIWVGWAKAGLLLTLLIAWWQSRKHLPLHSR